MSDKSWKKIEEIDKLIIQKKKELFALLEERKVLHRNLSKEGENGDN